ncbi:fumarylacetoacetate hydrolase family protein [Nocardia rhamnosiphila]
MPPLIDDLDRVLPIDAAEATLVGRIDSGSGPCVVVVRDGHVVDITSVFPTMSDLLESDDPVSGVRNAVGGTTWPLTEVLANSLGETDALPRLLAPVDLSVLKAAGVTFASSMLERLIEERTGGNPERAAALRGELEQVIGRNLAEVEAGSADAARLKADLQPRGQWSQYLEVGLGPDPEVFTKAPILSAVGCGAEIGIASISEWNNPEPEVAIAVTSTGQIVGATLGNDVNLRDIEGRSALLLPKAKDNNASAALGPFIRLFDDTFTLDDVRTAEVRLQVLGEDDGFVMDDASYMRAISRDITVLAEYTVGDAHQYPDGIVLYTGTLFSPIHDRGGTGKGFTHHLGDVVRISSPRLGTLTNRVNHSEKAPRWTFGVRAFIANLTERGLIGKVGA